MLGNTTETSLNFGFALNVNIIVNLFAYKLEWISGINMFEFLKRYGSVFFSFGEKIISFFLLYFFLIAEGSRYGGLGKQKLLQFFYDVQILR